MEEINFRLQHPLDALNRLLALKYLRLIGIIEVCEKLPEDLKEEPLFYEYTEDGEIQYDFNWEELVFRTPLSTLERMLEPHYEKLEEISAKEIEELKKLHEAKVESESIADINIYDIARAKIKESKDISKIIL